MVLSTRGHHTFPPKTTQITNEFSCGRSSLFFWKRDTPKAAEDGYKLGVKIS